MVFEHQPRVGRPLRPPAFVVRAARALGTVYVEAWRLVVDRLVVALATIAALRLLGAAFYAVSRHAYTAGNGVLYELAGISNQAIQGLVQATFLAVLSAALAGRPFRWWHIPVAFAVLLACVIVVWALLVAWALVGDRLFGIQLPFTGSARVLPQWFLYVSYTVVHPVFWALAFALLGPFVSFAVEGEGGLAGEVRRALRAWMGTFARILALAAVPWVLAAYLPGMTERLLESFEVVDELAIRRQVFDEVWVRAVRQLLAVGLWVLHVVVAAVACIVVVDSRRARSTA